MKQRMKWIAVAFAGLAAGCESDGRAPAPHDERAMTAPASSSEKVPLASDLLNARSTEGIKVSSPAIERQIPVKFSEYGQKFSPPLRFDDVPADAQSLVLMMEDPDAAQPKPFVHWLLYNLPPDTRDLHQAVPTLPKLPELGDALQGRNSRGSFGYYEPKPPVPDGPHRYYFMAFALDRKLQLPPGVDRQQLLDATKGHVLAKGSMVGTFDKKK